MNSEATKLDKDPLLARENGKAPHEPLNRDADYVCVTPTCKEYGKEGASFLFEDKGDRFECTECGQPARIVGMPVSDRAIAEAKASEPAARSMEDEVNDLLASAGIKREDIENWKGGEESEAAKAAEPSKLEEKLEQPDPKLVEYLERIKIESDYPEYPVAFITDAIKSDLSKREVDALVGEFRMRVSLGEIEAKAYSIVVTDSTQKDKMKEARELRLLLRDERIRIDQNAAAVKLPYLRKAQVIDPTRKHIRDMFKKVESYLKDQEEFAKREKEKKQEELRVQRWNILSALELENLADLKLAEMSEEAFEAVRSSAQTAFDLREAEKQRLENERILREEKAQRISRRQNTLSAAGLVYNLHIGYGYGDIFFPNDVLEDGTDEQFQAKLDEIKPKVDELRAAETRRQEKQRRYLDRCSSLQKLGMHREGDRYVYSWSSVSDEALNNKTDEEFQTILAETTKAVGEIKDRAERMQNRRNHLLKLGMELDDEKYRYAETEISIDVATVESLPAEEFKAKAADLAKDIEAHRTAMLRLKDNERNAGGITISTTPIGTDKEKLDALAGEFEAITFPEVKAVAAQNAVENVLRLRAGAVKILREAAAAVPV